MVSQNPSAAVQRQMQAIRGNLAVHADEVVKKARTKFDWRHYVVNYPWTALGGAVAVGYLLAPRRARGKACDPGTASPDSAQAAWRPSPLSSVVAGMMSAGTAIIAREGLAFATRCIKEFFEPQDSSAEGPAETGRSPLRP